MRWSLKKLNLRWHEYVWAAWPLMLAAVGGAIGGLCGAAAAAANLYVMRGSLRTAVKYGLTGVISLAAIGAYFSLATTISVRLITTSSIDSELQKFPAYVAMKKIEPALYSKLVDQVTDAAKHGAARAEITSIAKRALGSAVARRIAQASDDAVINSGRVLSLKLDQIAAKSIDACFAFIAPRPDAPADFTQYISAEVVKLDASTTVSVLETAAANPRPTPNRRDIEPMLREVAKKLISIYGEDAVNQLRNPAAMDHEQACRITSSLYKEALSLPRAQSAPLLRYLLAQPGST